MTRPSPISVLTRPTSGWTASQHLGLEQHLRAGRAAPSRRPASPARPRTGSRCGCRRASARPGARSRPARALRSPSYSARRASSRRSSASVEGHRLAVRPGEAVGLARRRGPAATGSAGRAAPAPSRSAPSGCSVMRRHLPADEPGHGVQRRPRLLEVDAAVHRRRDGAGPSEPRELLADGAALGGARSAANVRRRSGSRSSNVRLVELAHPRRRPARAGRRRGRSSTASPARKPVEPRRRLRRAEAASESRRPIRWAASSASMPAGVEQDAGCPPGDAAVRRRRAPTPPRAPRVHTASSSPVVEQGDARAGRRRSRSRISAAASSSRLAHAVGRPTQARTTVAASTVRDPRGVGAADVAVAAGAGQRLDGGEQGGYVVLDRGACVAARRRPPSMPSGRSASEAAARPARRARRGRRDRAARSAARAAAAPATVVPQTLASMRATASSGRHSSVQLSLNVPVVRPASAELAPGDAEQREPVEEDRPGELRARVRRSRSTLLHGRRGLEPQRPLLAGEVGGERAPSAPTRARTRAPRPRRAAGGRGRSGRSRPLAQHRLGGVVELAQPDRRPAAHGGEGLGQPGGLDHRRRSRRRAAPRAGCGRPGPATTWRGRAGRGRDGSGGRRGAGTTPAR